MERSSLNLNLSVFDLSKDELQKEYNNLRKNYKVLQEELENKSQQLYDCKRQLKVSSELEKDYLQEIESLQAAVTEEVKKEEQKLQRLEEEVINLSERNQYLENCLSITNKDKMQLEKELKEVVEKDSVKERKSICEDYLQEIFKLQEENKMLISQNEQMQVETGKLKEKNIYLEEKNTLIQKELENLKESLTCKKEELAESKNMCYNLQEELTVLRAEVENLKNKPLEKETKGNSLFAEVNDKRLEVQDKMAKMKKQYLQIQKEYRGKLNQISELRTECFRLAQQLEENAKLENKDHEYVISCYNDRIATLEELLEQSKKTALSIQSIPSGISTDVFNFIKDLSETKSSEIEELRKKLDSETKSRLLTAVHMRDANKELRQWKATAEQLQHKVAELEEQLTELQQRKALYMEDDSDNSACRQRCQRNYIRDLTLPNIQEKENKADSEDGMKNIDCSRHTRKLKSDSQHNSKEKMEIKEKMVDKENDRDRAESVATVEKRVAFSTDCVTDSKNTHLPRRGGKILETKSLYIPSKPRSK